MSRKITQALLWLSILHDMGTTKSLCAMRNDFCGGHAFAAIGALCFKVSMDYICGVAVLCIILVAMVAEMCGLGHLVFYYAKSPRKRHRLTAMYILNAGAFCACLSLVVYALDYMYAATAASPVITPFFYPGAGFAVAVVGTILVSIVPCCNQYWKIKKIEIVEPSKKDKGEAAFESLLDMPTWDRRQTGSFYHPPADFPSCVEMPTRQVLVNSTYITPAPQWNLASSTSSASLAGGWDYHPDYHGTYNC